MNAKKNVGTVTGRVSSKPKADDEVLKNRMDAFEKLSDDHRLGHYLWDRRTEADVAFGKEGMGLALHSVVSLIINAYRNPKLRKKIEAIMREV
jgi:hypothetical protein